MLQTEFLIKHETFQIEFFHCFCVTSYSSFSHSVKLTDVFLQDINDTDKSNNQTLMEGNEVEKKEWSESDSSFDLMMMSRITPLEYSWNLLFHVLYTFSSIFLIFKSCKYPKKGNTVEKLTWFYAKMIEIFVKLMIKHWHFVQDS